MCSVVIRTEEVHAEPNLGDIEKKAPALRNMAVMKKNIVAEGEKNSLGAICSASGHRCLCVALVEVINR